MMLCIRDILNGKELEEVCADIETLTFIDGRATAGWAARLVKNNEQAEASSRVDALRSRITAHILDNELFQIAVRPKALTPLLISRYGPGKQYGTHVDDALMQGMRTDVSFVESEEVGLSPFLRPLAQTARAVFPQAAFLCGRRR